MKVALYLSAMGWDVERELWLQRRRLAVTCREMGFMVVGVYEDTSEGWMGLPRRGLRKLMADAKRLRFNAVITLCLRRLDRYPGIAASLVEELKKLNVRIYSVLEGGWAGGDQATGV